jgi:hypothetical protein
MLIFGKLTLPSVYMRMMQRTISLKLNVPEGFLDYLKTCSVIFNRHVDWCYAEKSANKVKVHYALYYPLREEFPEVPSCKPSRNCVGESGG